MAEYTPVFANGTAPFTLQASAAITGGRLVASSGAGTVALAGAASGAKVQVWPLAGLTHKVLGSGAIAAGDGLAAGANGVVVTIAAGLFQTYVGVADRAAGDATLVRFVGR
jgi:hypothetical protein